MQGTDWRAPQLECTFARSSRAASEMRWAALYLLDATLATEDDFVMDIVLIVSELTANVVQHAGTAGVLRMWNMVPGLAVRIEVTDENTASLPMIRPDHDTVGARRGLRLVDRLASAWGVDYETGSKTIWAETVRADA